MHEPLIRDGVPGLEMAEEMEGLARDLMPLASPIMDHLHQRFLQHFVEQDVVGHLENEADEELDLGRLRVAIAFADLAGYTRLTEEAGEEQALDVVERFVEAVETTLPDEARIVKTIGDAVMIVSSDAGGADGVGRRLPGAAGASGRCRGSASTTARCSTATATTTGARSTSPSRVGARAAGARGARHARRRRRTARAHLDVPAHRRGAAEGLLERHRALPGAPRD